MELFFKPLANYIDKTHRPVSSSSYFDYICLFSLKDWSCMVTLLATQRDSLWRLLVQDVEMWRLLSSIQEEHRNQSVVCFHVVAFNGCLIVRGLNFTVNQISHAVFLYI